ncbi:ubiquitin ligase (cullin) of SCF [Coemansia sp. RSA 2322]|nr:ubiquitin ligase (cullin) of SCF [Coemansia sp. RSA 2322]
MNSSSLGDVDSDISELSTLCSGLGYHKSPARYQNGDVIVARVSRAVTQSLPWTIILRRHGGCKEAVRTLSCSSVYQPGSSEPDNDVPHYSELLNGVARACAVPVDELSDRLLATLARERARGRDSDAGAVGDLAVCWVLLFVLWWFGVWLVRRWSEDMARLRLALPAVSAVQSAACVAPPVKPNQVSCVYNYCTTLRSPISGSSYYAAADTTSNVHGVIFGRRLYLLLNAFVVENMEKVAERSGSFGGDDLLAFYNREWVRFGDAARMIHHIFGYLNRHWIQREQDDGNSVSNVNTLMYHQWRDSFFMQVRGKLLESVFNLMTRVRDGQVVDLTMVKSVADSFVSLGSDEVGTTAKKMDVYNTYFLAPFVKATVKYYAAESERLLQDGTIIDYIVRVAERFKEEDERAELYLHETSLSEFKHALTMTLIGKQKTSLQAEFKPMLVAHEKGNLRRLYQLLRRLDDKDGLEPLRAIFSDHVRQAGLDAVAQINAAAAAPAGDDAAAAAAGGSGGGMTNEARMFVLALLSVHDKYSELLRESFMDDPGFSKALDHACSDFVNVNAICPANENKASMLLATYCDMLLKKGSASVRKAGAEGASEDDNLEEQLSQAICVFRYIKGTDVFQKFYSRFLARRLVFEQSVSTHGEETMISKLKEVSGVDFTIRLTRMFNDMTVSKDMTEEFKEYARTNNEQIPYDFDMKVLHTVSWPLSAPDIKLEVPAALGKMCDMYSRYYEAKHPKHKLNWLWPYCKAEIKIFFPNATGPAAKSGYMFQVTTYQLVILLLFNAESGPGTGYDSAAGPTLTFAQIVAATGLGDEIVKSELEVFCKARMLNSSGANSSVVDTKGSYTLNADFKSKRLRINLAGTKKPEQKREVKETMKAVDEDRLFTIQAAIVRIMKSRKHLGHRQLIEETINQIKPFQAQVSSIKQTIDQLIDKSYLERDSNDRNAYNYLA